MASGRPSFEEALAFAAELIRIPSPSGGEEELARRVVREMHELGYGRAGIDDAGNVIGVIDGRGTAPPVMLSCHLDAVDVGDPEGWEHPPFSGAVEGGFLHGRGAMDIKGPLALQTYAAAILGTEDPPRGDVIVAHTVLEERGGWGMARLLASGAVEPGAAIVGEATHGDLAIGHRGRAELEVTVHGTAGHASAPERARNALDGVPRVMEAVRALSERQPHDSVLGSASVVVTDVEARPGSRNVIPDRATVVLDWRILPEMDGSLLVARVREALEALPGELPDGLRVEVALARERQRTFTGLEEDRPLYTPGFLLEAGDPVVRAAAEAVREGTGREPDVRPWTFATDGGHICGVHGIPTVGFAPGEERYAHTNEERLEVEEARRAFEAYPGLVRAVQAAVG